MSKSLREMRKERWVHLEEQKKRNSRAFYEESLRRDKQRMNSEEREFLKRCPFCRGERGRFEGRGMCWKMSCDRGPNGGTCGCHYQMTGMGSPGAEMWARIRQSKGY